MGETNVRIHGEEAEFTLRAAALIVHEQHLLVVYNTRLNCYYTVGGGVRPMEDTACAAQREVLEETGVPLRAQRLAYVQERFYEHGGRAHHEVVFFYRMEGDVGAVKEGRATDRSDERLCWLPVEHLGEYSLLPTFLAEEMKAECGEIRHILSREGL